MAHRARSEGAAALPMAIDSGHSGLANSRHNPLANASMSAIRESVEPAEAPTQAPADDLELEAYNAISGIIPSTLIGQVWTVVQAYAKAHATRTRAAPMTSSAEEQMTEKITKAVAAAVATALAAAPAATTNTSRPSYASIAARSTNPTPSGSSERSTRSRVEREVTVRTRDAPPDIQNRTPRDAVAAANRARGDDYVIAARYLPSGDTVLTFLSSEKAKAKCNDNWVGTAFGNKAALTPPTFAVYAKGIRLASVPNDTSKLITEIERTNNVKITQIKKTKGRPGPNPRANLVIRTSSIRDANRLCDNGLLLEAELYDCEPFNEGLRPTQCFNCFKFGHIARVCKATPTCGRCGAAAHENCPTEKDEIPLCCILCQGSHPAWSRACPVAQPHWERAKQGYTSRPLRFQDNATQRPDFNYTEILRAPPRAQSPKRPGRPLGSINKHPRTSSSTSPTRGRAGSAGSSPLASFVSNASSPSPSPPRD